jgi:hypothetical protein
MSIRASDGMMKERRAACRERVTRPARRSLPAAC